MTLIIDMATGSEYPREAPGYGDAGAVKAHHRGAVQPPPHIELRLAVIESTPTGHHSAVPPGIDIAELIRTTED